MATPGDNGMETLVTARGVTVRFGGDAVLDGVDLSVSRGEIVTLIGPNGSGKTTLVRAILGLLAPDAGEIERLAGVRMGYVPQHMTVDQTLPLSVRRFLGLAAAHRRERIERALDEVGVGYVVDSPLHAISGGEMRRVLLAQALLLDPDLLVLDEPTAGVDVSGQEELYGLVRRLRDRRRCGVLMVSHDLHLVMAATDRVVCLNRHVCCTGQPETVSRSPEYLSLFGADAAKAIAVYAHAHDHRHEPSGEAVSEPASDAGRPERVGHG